MRGRRESERERVIEIERWLEREGGSWGRERGREGGREREKRERVCIDMI